METIYVWPTSFVKLKSSKSLKKEKKNTENVVHVRLTDLGNRSSSTRSVDITLGKSHGFKKFCSAMYEINNKITLQIEHV